MPVMGARARLKSKPTATKPRVSSDECADEECQSDNRHQGDDGRRGERNGAPAELESPDDAVHAMLEKAEPVVPGRADPTGGCSRSWRAQT